MHGKALTEIRRGVQEIRVTDNKEAFRVINVASIGNHIVVLHAFHEKFKLGISAPKMAVELARARYRMLIGGVGATR